MKVYLFLFFKNYVVIDSYFLGPAVIILFRTIYSCATKLRDMKMYASGGIDPRILDLVIRHRL